MIQRQPRFNSLEHVINLVTGEKVEILECRDFQGFGYGYCCRSVQLGGLYEVNEQAYYPESILSNLPLIVRKGKIGTHDYLIYVVSPLDPSFYSIMVAIDGVFRTGSKKVGCFSSLIGDFVCPDFALKVGLDLVMEELQNERRY